MFLYILLNNIAPIFTLVAIGFYLGKRFNLDVFTLSKINFYILIPSLIFSKIYESTLDFELLRSVLFTLFFVFLQYFIASIAARLLKLEPSKSFAFRNAVTFFNTGNIGLPLITLIFTPTPYAEFAITAQVMIMVTQNLFTFTLGFFGANKENAALRDSIKTILKLPIVYAIGLALLLKLAPFDISEMFFWPSIVYARQGMISIALLTLGIQLSAIKINLKCSEVYIATAMRLLLGPMLAFFLTIAMGIDGVLAQVILISSAVPTAINTALIAVEANSQADFATQAVVTSTLLSSFTLPIVVYIAQNMLR